MTVHTAMKTLENLGCSFRLAEGGGIKFRFDDGRPPEASALLEIARSDRAAAAEYIRQREAGAVVVDDGCTYSMLDALAIGQAVKRGDAVLLAPVVFHVEPVNVSVYWQPVRGVAEAVLEWHRERLEAALCRRLEEMQQQDLDGLTDAEIDDFCGKYARYKMIFEVSK